MCLFFISATIKVNHKLLLLLLTIVLNHYDKISTYKSLCILFLFQKTVKDYIGQKFQNLCRKFEPLPTDGQVKSKIIAAQHTTPVVAFHLSSSLEEGDAVAYEQNVQLLKVVLSKVSPNNNRIHPLLKLTHATRRRQIEIATFML